MGLQISLLIEAQGAIDNWTFEGPLIRMHSKVRVQLIQRIECLETVMNLCTIFNQSFDSGQPLSVILLASIGNGMIYSLVIA